MSRFQVNFMKNLILTYNFGNSIRQIIYMSVLTIIGKRSILVTKTKKQNN